MRFARFAVKKKRIQEARAIKSRIVLLLNYVNGCLAHDNHHHSDTDEVVAVVEPPFRDRERLISL